MPGSTRPGMKLTAFTAASLALAITPGPGVLFIVARTLAEGRAAGLCAVAGVAAGNLVNAVAASLGLAALFALWPTAFTALRWGGGLVLLWLGWAAWRPPAPDTAAPARQAFWVALLNPKTTLFFAALLHPSWIRPARRWRRAWRSRPCSSPSPPPPTPSTRWPPARWHTACRVRHARVASSPRRCTWRSACMRSGPRGEDLSTARAACGRVPAHAASRGGSRGVKRQRGASASSACCTAR